MKELRMRKLPDADSGIVFADVSVSVSAYVFAFRSASRSAFRSVLSALPVPLYLGSLLIFSASCYAQGSKATGVSSPAKTTATSAASPGISVIPAIPVIPAMPEIPAMPGAPVVTPRTVNAVDVRSSLKPDEVLVTATLPLPLPVAAPAHVFKKKILAPAFTVSRLGQVQDIEDIAHGFPRELLLRLEKSGAFLVRSSPDLLSFTLQTETPGVNLIKQVAAEFDSQFIISGEIRNAGVQVDKKFMGLWETRTRHMEIELAIYDGVSGALLIRHNLHKQAADQANIGRDRPFGSAAFYATTYGQAINAILDESAALIVSDLQQLPVLARILKLNKDQVIFDVGATSALAVGDVARLIVANNELPALGLRSHQPQIVTYGAPHFDLGKVEVVQVQNLFAVGQLSDDIPPGQVKVGDFVRFDKPATK
jgi:hypothetical protein